MNRSELRSLQSIQQYPSLSLILPTHRTAPANLQDPTRLRNLQTEAANRLLQEFSARELAPLLERLEALIAEVDFRYTLDGLVLYVNQDVARKFYVPFSLNERVVIDHTFATRDLVFAMNRSSRYWVLALSEQSTRLFEGTRETLIEITDGKFPMVHGGAGGAAKLPGGQGINTSAYQDDQHRQFFRSVDAEFNQLVSQDPLPLVLVGVDRYFSFYQEVATTATDLLATVRGNHDATPIHELGELTWAAAAPAFADRRAEVMEELNAAMSAQRVAFSIAEIWRAAQEGRGKVLLVEEDFYYPAEVDTSGMQLSSAADATLPGVIDDAVDEVIETVMTKGGRVVFVDNGKLENLQRMALILRY